jgi:hypothetical protein
MNKQILIAFLSTATVYAAENSKTKLSSSEEFYQNLSDHPAQSQKETELRVKKDLQQFSYKLIEKEIETAEEDPLITALLEFAKAQTESESKASWVAFGTALHFKVIEQLK